MLLLHYGMSGRAGRGEDGRGKARHGERGNADAAIADLQADLAVAPFVKVVMGGEEGIRIARRHTGETVAVMMAVAFGMADAEEGDQRRIILPRDARRAGDRKSVVSGKWGLHVVGIGWRPVIQ